MVESKCGELRSKIIESKWSIFSIPEKTSSQIKEIVIPLVECGLY